jgi:hypothetical protein
MLHFSTSHSPPPSPPPRNIEWAVRSLAMVVYYAQVVQYCMFCRPLFCYNYVACDVDVQHAFLQARGSFTDQVSEVCQRLGAPTSLFVGLPNAASVSRLLVPRAVS